MEEKIKQQCKDITETRARSLLFTDWILDKYDHCFIPQHFYIDLNKIYKGEHPLCYGKPIDMENLWELWELSWKELERIHWRNERKGKIIEGYTLIKYDMSVILGKYDEYVRNKKRKSQNNEHTPSKEPEIDFKRLLSAQNIKKEKRIDISAIADEI